MRCFILIWRHCVSVGVVAANYFTRSAQKIIFSCISPVQENLPAFMFSSGTFKNISKMKNISHLCTTEGQMQVEASAVIVHLCSLKCHFYPVLHILQTSSVPNHPWNIQIISIVKFINLTNCGLKATFKACILNSILIMWNQISP